MERINKNIMDNVVYYQKQLVNLLEKKSSDELLTNEEEFQLQKFQEWYAIELTNNKQLKNTKFYNDLV